MSKVKEIEKSISMLPKDDLAVLREWFEDLDAKMWDEQFENDAKSGKLDALLKRVEMKLNFLIILMIIALTLMNPVMAEIIKGLLKL